MSLIRIHIDISVGEIKSLLEYIKGEEDDTLISISNKSTRGGGVHTYFSYTEDGPFTKLHARGAN